MENDVLGVLYSTLNGLRLTDRDLNILANGLSRGEPNSSFQLSLLSQEAQDFLKQARWKDRWHRFLDHASEAQIRYVSVFCDKYPAALKLLPKPPLFLTYLGEPIWKNKNFFSVVGSRTPSRESLSWMTQHLLPFLKENQLSVVSGGARGVDQWAHQVSIAAGTSTLCLVPSGLRNIYPHSLNSALVGILDSGGCVLSGYDLQQSMRLYFFHQRNRWIAQLGGKCLVIESRLKSGSYLTAQLALNLGKDVAALPFSVWERQGQGNLQLLQDGAALVRNQKDLQDFLGF